MKIIPKGQNGLVVKSDNTKVVQRPVIFPIKYKIKPGEMPLDNLRYFQKLENGKYSYQGTIIPDKRINVENY